LSKVFNIANLLSVLRIFASIPLIIFLNNLNQSPYLYYSILVILFIIISDILDGYLARKNNNVTNFGKIIDPVADKVCLMAVLIYLITIYQTPFFIFFILLSIRDIVLLAFSVYFLIYTDYVPQANKYGKLFVFITSLMLIFFIYSIHDIVSIILYVLSLFLLVYSMYVYIKFHLKRIYS